jgi:four helix bundle protein
MTNAQSPVDDQMDTGQLVSEENEGWDDNAGNDTASYPQGRLSYFRIREDGCKAGGNDKASKLPFDLEERTARFGESITRFVKKIPQHAANNRIIDQLVGCGTSIGGNYCEADEAVSKKEFIHKIGICKKEAKGTKFFLRIAASAEPSLKAEARDSWREKLHLIFAKTFRSSKGK